MKAALYTFLFIVSFSLHAQVDEDELSLDDSPPPTATPASGKPSSWVVGLGGTYTDFNQKGKSFQTSDQTHYDTSDYISNGLSPTLSVQYGRKNFWRLNLGYFSTHYSATANDNVGDPAKPVLLTQNFVSLQLERAWLVNPWLYFAVGAEIDQALSVNLTLGGNVLPTTSQDRPLYLGGFLGIGGQAPIGSRLGLLSEVRLGAIANQSPYIAMIQATLGVAFRL